MAIFSTCQQIKALLFILGIAFLHWMHKQSISKIIEEHDFQQLKEEHQKTLEDLQNLQEQQFIVVLGRSQNGKSSFINEWCNSKVQFNENNDGISHTTSIQMYECNKKYKEKITVLDTQGFGDSREDKKNEIIYNEIKNYVWQQNKSDYISAVIIVEDISSGAINTEELINKVENTFDEHKFHISDSIIVLINKENMLKGHPQHIQEKRLSNFYSIIAKKQLRKGKYQTTGKNNEYPIDEDKKLLQEINLNKIFTQMGVSKYRLKELQQLKQEVENGKEEVLQKKQVELNELMKTQQSEKEELIKAKQNELDELQNDSQNQKKELLQQKQQELNKLIQIQKSEKEEFLLQNEKLNDKIIQQQKENEKILKKKEEELQTLIQNAKTEREKLLLEAEKKNLVQLESEKKKLNECHIKFEQYIRRQAEEWYSDQKKHLCVIVKVQAGWITDTREETEDIACKHEKIENRRAQLRNYFSEDNCDKY